MKDQKTLPKIIAILVLALAFFPVKSFGQIFKPPTSDTGSDTVEGLEEIEGALAGSGVAETGDFGVLVLNFVNFTLPFLALAAFVAFVYAGFLYVTAYGSEDQIGKSKKVMIYAVIGLILVILSFSIVRVFTETLVEDIGASQTSAQPASGGATTSASSNPDIQNNATGQFGGGQGVELGAEIPDEPEEQPEFDPNEVGNPTPPNPDDFGSGGGGFGGDRPDF